MKEKEEEWFRTYWGEAMTNQKEDLSLDNAAFKKKL